MPSSAPGTDTRPGAGRPVDEELTRRILAAALTQLDSVGYAHLKVEHVAAAVDCGKAAIYRRWPTRAALAAAALLHRSRLGTPPDTGDVVEDLVEHALQNLDNQRRDAAVPDGHAWAAVVEPEVRPLLWQGFLGRRRELGHAILHRAVERGQLPPDTDGDAVLDVLAGFTFYRNAIRPAPVRREQYRAVVAALVAAPPRNSDHLQEEL
ncbi:TetR family transcriptional regulator [Kineococcus sp. R8]|uniref:TetR/AcrR family transcriptional regulator n=1 Tax=Kineococcus siccus TaxID=2696567 RepID=UPI001411F4A6|nr:TetR/AcrR family transcriptional regulator [Kineococcus siccus]NAZ82981.1 TetR family transcriptional regulator [Kineococcus siccus]